MDTTRFGKYNKEMEEVYEAFSFLRIPWKVRSKQFYLAHPALIPRVLAHFEKVGEMIALVPDWIERDNDYTQINEAMSDFNSRIMESEETRICIKCGHVEYRHPVGFWVCTGTATCWKGDLYAAFIEEAENQTDEQLILETRADHDLS